VLAVSPVRLLAKLPVILPSIVLLLPIVGFTATDQHTPLVVITLPPSEVILPPEIADERVTELTVAVVRVGIRVLSVEVSDLSFLQESVPVIKPTKIITMKQGFGKDLIALLFFLVFFKKASK